MSHKTVVRFFLLVSFSAAFGATRGTGSSRELSSPVGLGNAFGQIDAGYLADVKDLKVTVTSSPRDSLTDVSLELAPPEPIGAPGVTLVFRARFHGRTVDVGKLAEIVLRAHYRLRSDDRLRSMRALNDTHQLSLHIDPQDPSGITLDFFPANWGYVGFTAPGDEIPVSFFTVRPEDLRALGVAKEVTGEVLWTSFRLTQQELEALQSFARQVLPAVRPKG
jgi:hypothetical protein